MLTTGKSGVYIPAERTCPSGTNAKIMMVILSNFAEVSKGTEEASKPKHRRTQQERDMHLFEDNKGLIHKI